MLRLDRALANMGLGTRKEIKELIKDKRVFVNGELVKKSDLKICEEDEIMIDDEIFYYQEFVYIMLNKPAGVISATEGNEMTVIDLIPNAPKGLFPCGRLDKDTTGLLLLTNDGQLAHKLLAPKSHVEKEYEVVLARPVSAADIAHIAQGISDGEDHFMPAKYTPTSDTSGNIILYEGKFHEIKRIFASLGNEVIGLKRIRMKDLILDVTLNEGEYRPLSEEELKALESL